MSLSRLALRNLGRKFISPVFRFPVGAVRTIVSLEEARKMPRNYNEIPNDILLNMAVTGDQEAREERLIREIMIVDNLDW
jgi:hypothetical protein